MCLGNVLGWDTLLFSWSVCLSVMEDKAFYCYLELVAEFFVKIMQTNEHPTE